MAMNQAFSRARSDIDMRRRGSMRLELTMLQLCRARPDRINISAAIDEFGRRHPRRLELANILQD